MGPNVQLGSLALPRLGNEALSLPNKLEQANRLDRPALERIADYEQILQDAPDLEEGHAQLGKLYKLTQALEKSVLHYKRAFQLCRQLRQRSRYANDAAISCALLHRTDLAYTWWQQAIDLDPSFINPYLSWAHALESEDKTLDALSLLQTAQRIAPGDIRSCYSLARIYSKQNQWKDALAQYQRQLSLEIEEGGMSGGLGTPDAWTYNNMATAYLQLQNLEQAKVQLSIAAKMAPDSEAGQYAALVLETLSLG